ncbi:MAG: ATP-binding protein [Gammaproteobacteria bacterium]|nr:ATP-binding protein [Gammaproteobacteria bacterium]
MALKLFSSISSKIVILISLVLVVTATSIMYFTQRDVGKTMFDAQQKSARNVLELVRLNIRGGYNRLIADKIDILNRMKADLKYIGHINRSVIEEFQQLASQQGAGNTIAKQRALKWLSKGSYEQVDVFVFNTGGRILGFSNANNTFEDFASVYDIKSRKLVEVMNSQNLGEEGDMAVFHWQADEQKSVKKLAYFIPVPEWGWTIAVAIDFDNIEAESERVLENIIKLLEKTFSKIKIASTGYAFLFTGDGEILIAPPGVEAAEMSTVLNSSTGNALIGDLKNAYMDEVESIRFPDPYSDNYELLEAHVSYFKAFDWYFAVVVPVVEIEAPGKAMLQRQMLVIGLIFLVSTVFTFVFVSKISRPLKVLSEYAKQLPKVDFTRESKSTDQIAKLPLKYTDEVGRLAHSFVFMEKELKKNITAAIESTAAKERLEREAAEEASRAKGAFLANMSHEIRTPINGMLGMLELLTHTDLNSRQKDFVMTLRESGNSLLSIINNILDFSKIEASRMELESTRFRPAEILENTAAMFAEMAQNKGLELVCTPDVELFDTYIGDPSRVQQIITNLCGNSIKFTEKGHVEMSANIVGREDGRVLVKVVIRDTGIGLEQDVQEHIFDSFSQADSSTTRRYGGTGLGLSICKHLVELMGGEIGVDSKQGKGSAFWFTMPLDPVAGAAADEEEHETGAEAPSQAQKLLLVTDSTVLGASFARRITSEQSLAPEIIAFAEVDNFIHQQRSLANDFDIIVCDLDADRDPRQMTELLDNLCRHSGSEAVRSGLLIQLKQKFADVVTALDRVDFAIAKPVPRVAIRRMLAGDGHFWLDRSSDDHLGQDSLADTRIGARILVAEDNPVNQKLVTEVLRIFGCELTLVENGEQAVQMFAENSYDMILMDCQMPEMDGFEATRRIRAMEREAGVSRAISIVALTANARKEDRDRCLACGMDDYLSKPFTMVQLRDMLFKWHFRVDMSSGVAPVTAQTDAETVADKASAADDSLLDIDTLNGIRALQNPQAPDILWKLLEIYLANAPELMRQLDAAIEDGNSESIREYAHSLKSASGNIGARKIFELSAEIENRARDGKLDGVAGMFEQVEQFFPPTCRLLEREVQRPAA